VAPIKLVVRCRYAAAARSINEYLHQRRAGSGSFHLMHYDQGQESYWLSVSVYLIEHCTGIIVVMIASEWNGVEAQ
jgi:hypothetical protein